ncbi:tRNA modification GTPase [Fimbriiglobus ruber]|uniref:tRNA modification GTPase MnmE n=1 Tax=Fimbriiglobus ruber TaxID=1908690 RepID=A0A225E0I0_9BACT|nr:GTPase [Fimbriiglobus ruber]OWK43496.1 GTPase and tRNA-U34 5-formylation enzyme TrmE [Fimbriiglobus ruber]
MTHHPDDTIAALSSAPGPGVRAIVRVTGPNARAVIDHVFRPILPTGGEGLPGKTFRPGTILLSGVPAPLPADLYFWHAPRTYTGQNLAELHTLSSPPLVERLVADLISAGARAAQPGEFTLRAFLAGKKDLPQAEAVLAVIESGTDVDLKKALAQLAGGVTRPLQQLRDDLLNLLADVEAGLDFVDEDIEFVSKGDQLRRVGAGIAHLTNLRRQLDDRTVSGRTIRVAIVGNPNAGKSSLFNALAGAPAALVGPVAGTTRDYLTRTIDLGGVAVELIDTAGWQHATDTIEEQAQRLGREQTGRADVVLWCVPGGESFTTADGTTLAATAAVVVRVATKCDIAPPAPGAIVSSVVSPDGTVAVRAALAETVLALTRPPLAPSQSRCRGHVEAATAALRRAHEHAREDDPQELLALALREALEQIGEMAGAVYTNDLLDRIFSRFCIGK